MSLLILASQSPRRAALLKETGFQFLVRTSDLDESAFKIEDPVKHVLTLSQKKAEAVRPEFADGLIIGADTIVFADGHILGKPSDRQDAIRMLGMLSGKTHEVYTGISLVNPSGRIVQDCAITKVTFRDLESWEIEKYAESGIPMDKAGAYGIQDRAGTFVTRIDGCYFNVVGFPLSLFHQLLRKAWTPEQIKASMCLVQPVYSKME